MIVGDEALTYSGAQYSLTDLAPDTRVSEGDIRKFRYCGSTDEDVVDPISDFLRSKNWYPHILGVCVNKDHTKIYGLFITFPEGLDGFSQVEAQYTEDEDLHDIGGLPLVFESGWLSELMYGDFYINADGKEKEYTRFELSDKYLRDTSDWASFVEDTSPPMERVTARVRFVMDDDMMFLEGFYEPDALFSDFGLENPGDAEAYTYRDLYKTSEGYNPDFVDAPWPENLKMDLGIGTAQKYYPVEPVNQLTVDVGILKTTTFSELWSGILNTEFAQIIAPIGGTWSTSENTILEWNTEIETWLSRCGATTALGPYNGAGNPPNIKVPEYTYDLVFMFESPIELAKPYDFAAGADDWSGLFS